MYTVRLQEFEGPLDLLWQLIQDQKLDLNQIALAQVADDFLGAVLSAEENARITLDEMADFLVVAAKLIYLKSKIFAPQNAPEDEDLESGVEELEMQMQVYKEYIAAGRKLAAMWGDERRAFARDNSRIFEAGFYPPRNLGAEKLAKALENLVARLKPKVSLPQQTIRRIISLQQKIMEIQSRLGQLGAAGGEALRFKFSHLLNAEHGAGDVVVTFLALLEMTRQNQIALAQTELFSEIEITKI